MNKKLCREIQKRNKWQPSLCGLCSGHKNCKDKERLKEQSKNES